ncbi:hypothetical protein Tco_0546724 [Tanacetum coccineum]
MKRQHALSHALSLLLRATSTISNISTILLNSIRLDRFGMLPRSLISILTPHLSITTWDLLQKAFVRQYCSPFKTAKKLEEICNSKPEVDELLYRAWERYSDLLYRCPHHDLNIQQRFHIFYTGLYIPTRTMLDSKGFIPLMTPTQALKSIQVMTDHSHKWYDEATTRERIDGSSDDTDIKKLDENIHVFQVSSKTCEGMHLTEECTL